MVYSVYVMYSKLLFAIRTFVSGPEYDIELQPSLADSLCIEPTDINTQQ